MVESNLTFGDVTRADAGIHRFSHQAMATLFEVLIFSDDPEYARQAASEAFREADRLEQELSRFLPNSDISRLNALPPSGEMLLGLDAFECLLLAEEYGKETDGAFDVTVGSLVDCLLTKDKALKMPAETEVRAARARTGMHHLALNQEAYTVKVHDVVPQIDLGAIGKGYAVDRMMGLLKDWDITSALVHGGMSSVFACGSIPGHKGWPVTLSSPGSPEVVLARPDVVDFGLGGSGVKKGRHIIDPRSALPVPGGRAAWVMAESAARADALSTACMVMTREEIARFCAVHADVRVLLVERSGEGGEEVYRYGLSGDASARLTENIS